MVPVNQQSQEKMDTGILEEHVPVRSHKILNPAPGAKPVMASPESIGVSREGPDGASGRDQIRTGLWYTGKDLITQDDARIPGQDAIYSFQIRSTLARAGRLNSALRVHGVDTALPDRLILSAQEQACLIGYPVAGDSLDQVVLGTSLSGLRHRYRRILVGEDLPPALAREVLAVAQLLDKTAGRLGYY